MIAQLILARFDFLVQQIEIMNDRQKRLKSVESQLLQIYEDLFGVEYKSTGEVDEGTQFKSIIERFHEKHFYVREMQKDREKKEKKKDGLLREELLKNQKIREEIKMCENLLNEAQARIKNGIKNQDKIKFERILKSRKTMLDECVQMLNNLKSVQYGEAFEPRKQHQTLNQLKKRLIKDEVDEINLQQEEALERFKRKDEDIENYITEVRKVDENVKGNLQRANENIKITHQMIVNNMKIADRVDTKIQKGTNDLRQILKHYRRPSKLCLDIILILLLIGLIGVIINMVKGSI